MIYPALTELPALTDLLTLTELPNDIIQLILRGAVTDKTNELTTNLVDDNVNMPMIASISLTNKKFNTMAWEIYRENIRELPNCFYNCESNYTDYLCNGRAHKSFRGPQMMFRIDTFGHIIKWTLYIGQFFIEWYICNANVTLSVKKNGIEIACGDQYFDILKKLFPRIKSFGDDS